VLPGISCQNLTGAEERWPRMMLYDEVKKNRDALDWVLYTYCVKYMPRLAFITTRAADFND